MEPLTTSRSGDTPEAEAEPSTSLQLDAPTEAEKQAAVDVKVARAMFFGGFAALPFLWLVAWVHFRKAAKLSHADPRLAVYVQRCLVGAVLGGLLLATWFVTVMVSWRSWGQFGRDLMLVLPWDAQEL